MSAMFKNPVFVKPLGIIVPPEAIGDYMAINVRLSRKYKLQIPETTTDELYLESQLTVRFSVTTTLPKEALYLAKGSKDFNDRLLAQATKLLAAQKEETVAPAPATRGRRRSKEVVEDVEEVPAINPNDLVEIRAANFGVLQLEITDTVVPLLGSKPYEDQIAVSDKHEEAINNKFGSLTAHVGRINGLRSKLMSPTQSSVEEAMGGLVRGGDDDLNAIDMDGLNTYENNHRKQIAALEEEVRKIYAWFERNIIDKATVAEETFEFKGDVTFGNEVTTLENIMEALRTEVFIEL